MGGQRSWTDRALAIAIRLRLPAMAAAAVLMVVAAVERLRIDVPCLLVGQERDCAIDLLGRRWEVLNWFGGQQVYGKIASAIYPPASYLELWPLVGPGDEPSVRLRWALVSIPLLLAMIALLWRLAGANSWMLRVLIALATVSGFACARNISNGQLGFWVLTALLGALVLLERPRRSLLLDLAIAALFVLALVKPSTTAPFFWLVLVSPRGWRPAALIVLLYGALTVVALAFQDADMYSVLWNLWYWGGTAADYGSQAWGYVNVWTWLVAGGLGEHTSVASIVCLALIGAWTYHNRGAHRVHLIGALAICSRLWTYHCIYDDLVVLLAMAALLRITSACDRDRRSLLAAILLAVTWALSLAPVRWWMPDPDRASLFYLTLAATWLSVLGFFLVHVHRARRRQSLVVDL